MNNGIYKLEELAEAAGLTPRTVRYYTAEGLLPPPDARGRFALYGEEHLRRLLLIQRLKNAYVPLERIRQQLEKLSDKEAALLLREGVDESPLPSDCGALPADKASAAAYISNVLGKQSRSPAPGTNFTASAAASRAPEKAAAPDAWYRIPLAPGLELHARSISPLVEKIIALSKGNVDEQQ